MPPLLERRALMHDVMNQHLEAMVGTTMWKFQSAYTNGEIWNFTAVKMEIV